MTKKKSTEAPQLGIFWLVAGKLIIDSAPLNEAEPYGDRVTHPRSHIDVWERLQRGSTVPPECEYEEYPRGRVMYRPKSGEYTILADKCILARKDLITQIKDALHLREKVKLDTDPHYKCHRCLYGEGTDDDWED